jgi:prophage DNA circulation protein
MAEKDTKGTKDAEKFPARFRDLGFYVTKSSLSTGRRNFIFEYPQRDQPFVEDLGRRARKLTITAIFVGPDHAAQMQKLIEAVENGDEGILRLPFFGSWDVKPTDATNVTYDPQKENSSSADITFVEIGSTSTTLVSEDLPQKTASATGGIQESALDKFIKDFDLKGVQDFIRNTVEGNLSKFFQLDGYKEICRLFNTSDEMSHLSAVAISLLSKDPLVFGTAVANAFGFSQAAYSINNWRRAVRLLVKLIESDGMNQTYMTGLVSETDASQTTNLSTSVQNLARQSLLAEAVSATTSVGGEEDTAEGGISYDEMIATRDLVLGAIDSEMLKTDDDDVYLALEIARSAVSEEMTARAQDSARLIFVTPQEVTPALVIAYNFYGDASRSQEIIDRNHIRHGGFVPAQELKLLSR